jgi:tryptophanyl-tRNA synthetase
MSTQGTKRILTGLQPSGILHIGNYFGAMKPIIDLQGQGDVFCFIVDYHAMTSVKDAKTLKSNIENVALDFIACGYDPEKTTFFRQSAVPEVHELAWYLSVLTPMGLLERCHSYKDKIANGISPNHGLFAYPVLMAADILIYDGEIVPVGKDQKQHVEVTRDLVIKFNEAYGDTFKLPTPVIGETVGIIPGLDGQKMSKSYNNTLELFAEEKDFRKKIMSLKTDSTPVEAPKPTEDSLILEYAKLFGTSDQVAAMKASMEQGGRGYGDYKKELFELAWNYLAPFRQRREEILKDKGYVEKVLKEGAEKARAVASKKMDQVRKAVGIA